MFLMKRAGKNEDEDVTARLLDRRQIIERARVGGSNRSSALC